jgi:D-glycero-alpha-D-manno-heptose-7-phosphate kinase
MIVRSQAPLRIGLAGGGTDVSPYSDIYGGAILNATIDLYAYASIIPNDRGEIVLNALDKGEKVLSESTQKLEIDGTLDLLKGVYNRIVKDYTKKPLSFELQTFVDAPPGSGLGSSSTLVVAILGAFVEWLKLPLGEYDIAHLAYEIERNDLGLSGGKQDQYAATFGGFNFMEFYSDDKVIVNPLRIKEDYKNELEFNFALYFTGTSRLSSAIIDDQTKNVQDKKAAPIEAMHQLKQQAQEMKEALLRGSLRQIGVILDNGWQHKKKMSGSITTPEINKVYEAAKNLGALGGKVSGAGGGGFMMLYCPGTKVNVTNGLEKMQGEVKNFHFTEKGLCTWTIL